MKGQKMSNNDFFSSVKPNSARKISIILNYFDYWLKKNSKAEELYYVDLFCGPGVYDNGEKSTPILILEKILKNKKVAGKFNIIFNDKNKNYINKLEKEVLQLGNIARLGSIKFSSQEVGKTSLFPNLDNKHGFVILDPWGYKGLSSNRIKNLVKNKNVELVFLFSFNQLYRFLKFKGIDHHLLNLFSKKSLKHVRKKIEQVENKETFLLENLMENMVDKNGNYLCYRFKFENQNKTSHFLIFLNHDDKTKLALLDVFINQEDGFVGEVNILQEFMSNDKNANSSCFVLLNVVKYINKLVKGLKYVIEYRVDRSNLESDYWL